MKVRQSKANAESLPNPPCPSTRMARLFASQNFPIRPSLVWICMTRPREASSGPEGDASLSNDWPSIFVLVAEKPLKCAAYSRYIGLPYHWFLRYLAETFVGNRTPRRSTLLLRLSQEGDFIIFHEVVDYIPDLCWQIDAATIARSCAVGWWKNLENLGPSLCSVLSCFLRDLRPGFSSLK